MIGGKFVFSKKILRCCVWLFRLIKTIREGSRMDRRAETDSCEGRRDQLGAGVPEANA